MEEAPEPKVQEPPPLPPQRIRPCRTMTGNYYDGGFPRRAGSRPSTRAASPAPMVPQHIPSYSTARYAPYRFSPPSPAAPKPAFGSFSTSLPLHPYLAPVPQPYTYRTPLTGFSLHSHAPQPYHQPPTRPHAPSPRVQPSPRPAFAFHAASPPVTRHHHPSPLTGYVLPRHPAPPRPQLSVNTTPSGLERQRAFAEPIQRHLIQCHPPQQSLGHGLGLEGGRTSQGGLVWSEQPMDNRGAPRARGAVPPMRLAPLEIGRGRECR